MNVFKLVLVMVFIGFTSMAQAGCYSDGIRVGVVQKISAKGYMSKSWEGEMVQEGIKSGQNGISNIWKFSTLNGQVAKTIEDAAMSGRPVALKYCQRNPIMPHLDIDSTYEIIQAVAR